jgi:voltage-gated potassium channel
VAFKYARSQEAYDRFSAATNLPLTLLAVLWLPTLVFPLVMNLPASVVRTFDLIDLVIWLLYGAEYLIRLYLSPSRTRFITHHLVDLAVVVLPVLRPLRAVRLLRLFNLSRAAVVLVNALTRVRGILTHRGLHFVLMGVTGIVVVASVVELAFEQHAHGANIHNFRRIALVGHRHRDHGGVRRQLPGHQRRPVRGRGAHAGRHRADRIAQRHGGELFRRGKGR